MTRQTVTLKVTLYTGVVTSKDGVSLASPEKGEARPLRPVASLTRQTEVLSRDVVFAGSKVGPNIGPISCQKSPLVWFRTLNNLPPHH